MVVLKKIRCSTLVENLVAIVILVSFFLFFSAVMQYYFLQHIDNRERMLYYTFNEDCYRYRNSLMDIPLTKQLDEWVLDYQIVNRSGIRFIQMTAIHTEKNAIVRKRYVLE